MVDKRRIAAVIHRDSLITGMSGGVLDQHHLTPGEEQKTLLRNDVSFLSQRALCQSARFPIGRATTEYCLMPVEKKRIVSREFRVTVTVEEIKAPNVADVPEAPKHPWTSEAEDFLDEADYSQ